MGKVEFALDYQGIGQLLRSAPMAAAVRDVAEQVADQVRAQRPGVRVVVDPFVTDRAGASVVVLDRRAAGWQARDGLLTRAAAAVGLEVTSR